MPPPFNIDNSSPAASSLVSAFPANEQLNRGIIEEWLTFISDPATGMLRASVVPPAFAAGTRMLFVQTAAPTGWTKDTTHNDKALRLVNGTVGTGGTVPFSTAFASKTVTGTTDGTIAGGTNSSTASTGTTNTTVPTGTLSSTVQGGSIGSTALAAAEMPSHVHTFSWAGSSVGGGNHTHQLTQPFYGAGGAASGRVVPALTSTGGTLVTFDTDASGTHTHVVNILGDTDSRGSGSGHTHTFSGNLHSHVFTGDAHSHTFTANTHSHTFTGNSHTHTFTGTAINLAVNYVDVIIAVKDA